MVFSCFQRRQKSIKERVVLECVAGLFVVIKAGFGGRRRKAAGAAALTAFVTAAVLLFPRTAPAEFAVGIAQDVIHAKEAQAVVLRYDYRPLRLGAYTMAWYRDSRANGAVAAYFNVGFSILDINLGGAYLLHTGDINGTHLNFSLGAAIKLNRHLSLRFTHISNGRGTLKGDDGRSNLGWNFVSLNYRF